MQTIGISKITSGCYSWGVHDGPNILVEGDPEECIEDCLSAAAGTLLDEPLVAISYRGVTVGTVIARRLDYEPGVVADWVFDCFCAVASELN